MRGSKAYFTQDDKRKLFSKMDRIVEQLCSSSGSSSQTANGTRVSVAVDGNIPAGAVAYKITNLGDGTNANQTSWTFDGDTIPATIQSISGSLNLNQSYPQLDYIANGNTLFIEYTTLS